MERMIQSVIKLDVLDEKMNKLKRNFQHLECRKDDIKEELKVLSESSSMKKPRKEVINWLKNVENIKNKILQLEQEVSSGSGLFKCSSLKRSVDNFTAEVMELDGQSKFWRGLTLDPYQKERVALITKRLVGEMFQKNKNMIWDCLVDGVDSIIGVYGMGGVGKTTLLKHIHNQLLDHHVNVFWFTVSQDFSICKLQHDIAKSVNLDISEVEDEIKRAAQLAQTLKRKKDIIIILDDVWEHICVKKVGIPVGENGCKLILTTRSLTVCRMMQCRSPVKVEPLSHEEAWILFIVTLGNESALLSYEIKEIAISLVKECGGLPLGIIIMAGSMRGVNDINDWRNALEATKDVEYWNGDMEFYEVFNVLKYSYDKLKDPKVQECLLYCSLFPEDALIKRDELIELFIMEKLIEGGSRKTEFYKAQAVLNKLEYVCLLEGQTDAKGTKFVKMHDLVRGMAIKIASIGQRVLVEAGMNLKDIPGNERWSEDLVRVSLMRNDISNVPYIESHRCSRLSTLLLRENYSLRVIPYDFFMNMKMLSVLDLSRTSIESLPSSISNLDGLTALLLGLCHRLCYVPSLKNLTALRWLDLRWTKIGEVHEGLEKLTNLRYLNLYGCSNLKMIPDGILPELSHIEYFMSESVMLNGAEIANWKNLETFWGRLCDIDDLKMCVKAWKGREPNNYTIIVKKEFDTFERMCIEHDKQVHLYQIDTDKECLLPTSMQFLSLTYCHGMASLSHIAKSSKALRFCHAFHCNMMRHVICSCCCNIPFSQSLEILILSELPKLTGLIERERRPSSSTTVLSIGAFSSLQYLEIYQCNGLTRLFTPAQLSQLQSLKRLHVSSCFLLVEIIGETSDQDRANQEATTSTTIISTPPRLSHLELSDLPLLQSFCSHSIRISSSLEEIEIISCLRLSTITLLWEEPYPPASLKSIKVQDWWWDSSLVAWKHPETKAALQQFVKYC
ncbi:NB-ARC domain, LRR domain containing protein [Trema orientale]|uniref:NB-ARC domain, LRR domain containing protein n=1 Tax=Trema orientale TaxID=63057 RepID=A0A2P5DBM4_TREOI|nr:NB-ARC domain, LRR domain containing protein [Trema orientale]